MPEISVIIPSYNNGPYIGRAIESVLNQSFSDLELIIIEDCSTDNSREIIASYRDPRIRTIYHEKNKGVSAARNSGIKEAKGTYIAILDADDVFLETRLERMYEEIRENPEIGLVHTDLIIITPQEEILGTLTGKKAYSSGYISGEVFRRRGCHLGQPLMKKECIESVGYYDETLIGGEDYDLYHRLTHCYSIAYVQESLYLYRFHQTNATKKYRSILTHYKAYLDKSFAADHEGVYTSVQAEAYSHYFLDLIFVWIQECSKSTFFSILCEIKQAFQSYGHHIPSAIIPFIKVTIRRIKRKAKKKIAQMRKKPFIQIGW